MLTLVATLALASGGPLQLAEVLEATDRAFPLLLAARADVEGAEGDALLAVGAFDPVWRTRGAGVPLGGYPQFRVDSVVEAATPLWGSSFFAGYRLGIGKFQSYYGERETWSAGELRAGASVPVLRNGPIDRRRTNDARAQLARDAATLSLEQQRLEFSRVAAWRYWDWVAAGQRAEVARQILVIARERDAQFSARLSAGDAARFDRQDNLRILMQREALLVQTQRSFQQASFELSLYLRDAEGRAMTPGMERVPTMATIAETPAFDLEAVLARRPGIARLLAQRRSAQLELELQQNQLLPGLDVGVAVSKDLGVSPGASTDGLGPTELELNLTFELPVLWRAPRGRIQSARAVVARLDAQLNLARDRVRVELADATSALDTARERIGFTRREVEAAEEVERLERQRFALGDGSLLFVNLREQATAEARLRYIDALVDGQRAWASLQVAAARVVGDTKLATPAPP